MHAKDNVAQKDETTSSTTRHHSDGRKGARGSGGQGREGRGRFNAGAEGANEEQRYGSWCGAKTGKRRLGREGGGGGVGIEILPGGKDCAVDMLAAAAASSEERSGGGALMVAGFPLLSGVAMSGRASVSRQCRGTGTSDTAAASLARARATGSLGRRDGEGGRKSEGCARIRKQGGRVVSPRSTRRFGTAEMSKCPRVRKRSPTARVVRRAMGLRFTSSPRMRRAYWFWPILRGESAGWRTRQGGAGCGRKRVSGARRRGRRNVKWGKIVRAECSCSAPI